MDLRVVIKQTLLHECDSIGLLWERDSLTRHGSLNRDMQDRLWNFIFCFLSRATPIGSGGVDVVFSNHASVGGSSNLDKLRFIA
jgi:hypothetical protein